MEGRRRILAVATCACSCEKKAYKIQALRDQTLTSATLQILVQRSLAFFMQLRLLRQVSPLHQCRTDPFPRFLKLFSMAQLGSQLPHYQLAKLVTPLL